jgi:hypothetical protein
VVAASTTLAFLGDLMLGRRVSELRTKPPEWISGDVLPRASRRTRESQRRR